MGGGIVGLVMRVGLAGSLLVAAACSSSDRAIDSGSVAVVELPDVGETAAMVPTSSGVVMAGGFERVGETERAPLSDVAVLIERGSSTPLRLPDLPEGTWASFGAEVGGRVYLVGRRCPSAVPVRLDVDCRDATVLALAEDSARWESVEGAAEALGGSDIGMVGAVDGQLAIVPAGSLDTLFHLYDPAADEWARVDTSAELPTASMLYCFGPASVFAFRFVEPIAVSNESIGAGDQRRAYQVWAYTSGRWSDRHDVDLGLEAGESSFRPVLCGPDSVAFFAPDGRDAAVLSVSDGQIVGASVPDPPPVPTLMPTSPNQVLVSGRGALIWLSADGELPVSSPVEALRPSRLLRNGVADGWAYVAQRNARGTVQVVSLLLPG